MPTFDTPEPIVATIELVMGDVRIRAGDGGTTTVTVRPSDPSNAKDLRVSELTRVEYTDRRLLVKGARLRSWFSMGGSIEVAIELPAGSQVHGTSEVADFHVSGRLGECRLRTGIGRIRLDDVETLTVKSGAGDISVERVAERAEVTSGSGAVRLGEVYGSAVVKNANGDTWVGAAHADLRVSTANGRIAVDLAGSDVAAKSANGGIHVGEVVRGSVVLETQVGDLEVGIREGTSAWLDVNATAGRVRNALEAADASQPSDETVEVRARTKLGDIVITRSPKAQP